MWRRVILQLLQEPLSFLQLPLEVRDVPLLLFDLFRRPVDDVTHRKRLVMGSGYRIGPFQRRKCGIVPGDQLPVDRIIGGNVLGGPNETAEHPCGDRRNYELGRAFDRPVSLHQSAASRMLSKTSSGSPPPFLFTMQALLLALT